VLIAILINNHSIYIANVPNTSLINISTKYNAKQKNKKK